MKAAEVVRRVHNYGAVERDAVRAAARGVADREMSCLMDRFHVFEWKTFTFKTRRLRERSATRTASSYELLRADVRSRPKRGRMSSPAVVTLTMTRKYP